MARVMVVEDDQGVRRAIARMLENDGHEVVEEANGHSALRHFAGDPVDLVLSDVYMPDMDGLDLLKRLREGFPEAKIVMVSGGGRLRAESVLEAAKALGASRVLAKPFSPEEIRDIVNETLAEEDG